MIIGKIPNEKLQEMLNKAGDEAINGIIATYEMEGKELSEMELVLIERMAIVSQLYALNLIKQLDMYEAWVEAKAIKLD